MFFLLAGHSVSIPASVGGAGLFLAFSSFLGGAWD